LGAFKAPFSSEGSVIPGSASQEAKSVPSLQHVAVVDPF